jgi:hypothetical protein
MFERCVESVEGGHQSRERPAKGIGEPVGADRCGQRADGRFGHGDVTAVRAGRGRSIGAGHAGGYAGRDPAWRRGEQLCRVQVQDRAQPFE